MLGLLCACLTAGYRGGGSAGGPAAWLAAPSTDLVRLARLAGRHLVTPMLAACAADPALGPRLPDDFRRYVTFVHSENARRNRALRLQLGEAVARLNGIGVEPVLLKGAARLADGLYPDPGWRVMRDLDLLVPRDQLAEAAACLRSAGYRFLEGGTGWSGRHHHLPQLARDGALAVVEVHAEPLPDRRAACPAEAVIARSRAVDLGGAAARLPAAADQLALLLVHDRLDHCLAEDGLSFLLRSAFEAALLCRDPRDAGTALAQCGAAGLGPWAAGRVALAARLFPALVPDPLAGRAARLRAGMLAATERWDEGGSLRRLSCFAGRRAGELLASPATRARVAGGVLSPAYQRHCASRLRELWRGG